MRPHMKEGHFHSVERISTTLQRDMGATLPARADTTTIRIEAARLWYALKIACVAFKAS